MRVEIKGCDGNTICAGKFASVREAVEDAVNTGANLRGAKGKQRAYKIVRADGYGIYYGRANGGFKYEVGKTYSAPNANTNIHQSCGAGINVATLDWCMREWLPGYRILVVEFAAKDIAAIPTSTDGKFRLHRCKVVGEKDLAELGLIESEDGDENKG